MFSILHHYTTTTITAAKKIYTHHRNNNNNNNNNILLKMKTQQCNSNLLLKLALSILVVFQITTYYSTIDNTTNKKIQQKNIYQNPPKNNQNLEYVHITKTGGSAIESAGCNNGYRWGALHYKTNVQLSKVIKCTNVGTLAPENEHLVELSKGSDRTLWHVPPVELRSILDDSLNPYMDPSLSFQQTVAVPEQQQSLVKKKLFTVVRNPYSRILSEINWSTCYVAWGYCPPKWRLGGVKMVKSKKVLKDMNDQLQTILTTVRQGNFKKNGMDGLKRSGHFLNQVNYVYAPGVGGEGDNNNNVVIIDYVLHYENLQTDFHNLMLQYGVKVTLPSKEESHIKKAEMKNKEKQQFLNSQLKFDLQDLNTDSIRMINEYAYEDFKAFGYEMVDVGDNGGGGGTMEGEENKLPPPLYGYDPSPRIDVVLKYLQN